VSYTVLAAYCVEETGDRAISPATGSITINSEKSYKMKLRSYTASSLFSSSSLHEFSVTVLTRAYRRDHVHF